MQVAKTTGETSQLGSIALCELALFTMALLTMALLTIDLHQMDLHEQKSAQDDDHTSKILQGLQKLVATLQLIRKSCMRNRMGVQEQ
jgi:hypothetical protein